MPFDTSMVRRILLGDFNYYRAPSNRNKPGGNANDMLVFNEFIRAQSLMELPIKGRRFSWSNMQHDPLLKQIDWFFTSMNWTTTYPNTVVLPLGKPVSDHIPCTVRIQSAIPASKIFRFESFWAQHQGFLEVVQSSWEKPCHAVSSAARLCRKFKNLRYDLKKWSKGISKLNILIENCNKILAGVDELENYRPLSIPEINFRKILKSHLLNLLSYQQEYWKKICTVRIIQFGDENTKFFHRMATARYRRNSIATLTQTDGTVVAYHAGKEKILFDTYKERLGKASTPQMKFALADIIKKVDGLEELTTPFTREEINGIIKDMPADRAPGPDGFNGLFLKKCWHIIKEDFYQLCFDFYEGNLNIESINDGFITLIPKTNSPETANDYRPITLLNCCLKVITKLLANRLQKVVLKIIHKNQYGFLKGRSIQDCIAWAFEYIFQCQNSGRKVVLLKLDFAKAFDTIEHSAMLEIMRCMGFDDRWLRWIKCIFSSGKSAVLLNGTPGRQFHCKYGVRQGDPMSPLIFVLAADLLQAAINDAASKQHLMPPIPSRGSTDYPVIQYADDTIIVMPADMTQVAHMKGILMDYAQSIGLKINFQKTTLIPINVDPLLASQLANLLQCSVGKMPFTYLGLPLGTTKPTVLDMMPLVDSMERRLSTTLCLMSIGAKLQLVNSVLSSLAVYAMCSIRLPPKIIEHLDKLRRYCLWRKKQGEEVKCNSLAAWNMVCKLKDKGGLGIIDIKLQNTALLLKQLHKFYNHADLPWVELVWESYYTESVPHASDTCGSFWWRELMKLSGIYRGITKASVGIGDAVLFWKDLWLDQVLDEAYPRAASFAKSPDSSVHSVLTCSLLDQLFHLPLSIQARDELRQIQFLSAEVRLTTQRDSWRCPWGEYTAKRFYEFCFREVQVDPEFCLIWKSKCTMKIKVFLWLLLADRMNTRDMLRRRHYNIGNDLSCMLCDTRARETVEHLFFDCPFSVSCWNKLNITWPDQGDRMHKIHTSRTSWQGAMFTECFATAAWSLWKERNNKYFKSIPNSCRSWADRFKEDFGALVHRKSGLGPRINSNPQRLGLECLFLPGLPLMGCILPPPPSSLPLM